MESGKSFLKLFESNEFSATKLIIPIYQRKYEWTEKNCMRLLKDLMNLMHCDNPERKHFFGSIILKMSNGKITIIDGQQRITTISLLIAAIRDSTSDQELMDTADKLLKTSSGSILLNPVANDLEAYEKIIEGLEEKYDLKSNITKNYLFFKEKLRNIPDLKLFLNAINQLSVFNINLDENDDAQAVFESINSTGMALSEGDKIRNYLLMNHSEDDLNYFYKKYWIKIDDGTVDLSDFFRDYLTAITGDIPTQKHVYEDFVEHSDDKISKDCSYEPLFEELLHYKNHYSKLLSSELSNISKKCSKIMYQLNYQKTNVVYPFLLRILECNRIGKLSNDEVEKSLAVIENYLIRRFACGSKTNAHNKVFKNLFQIINKNNPDNFVEMLKYQLLSKTGDAEYPRDPEVEFELTNKDLYTNRACALILATIENANEDSDVFKNIVDKDHKLTIEHVMPQKLNNAWKIEIGEGYEEIHAEYVHKLGNLTLTAYNSDYSNKSYTDKRELPGKGFLHSPLNLNKWMKENERWTEKLMIERGKELSKKFIKSMPELTSTYDETYELPLDRKATEYIGKTIVGYTFKGEKHTSKNGKEAYLLILKEFYNLDPKLISESIINKNNRQLRTWFTDDLETADTSKEYTEVFPGIWVYASLNHGDKASIIQNIMKIYGMKQTEISFLCRNEIKPANDTP